MLDAGNPYADTSSMYVIHTMFRREFAQLPDLVRGVAANDRERAGIVAGHIRLVSLILDEHHSAEDAVLWPRLLKRAPREIDPVVHLAEGHHQGIEALIGEINPVTKTWHDSAATANGEVLADLLERLAVALHEHMDLEEKLILPLVERHIFASEWERMVADAGAGIPPEYGPVVVGMVMYEGGPDALPSELRAIFGEAGPQAYAAHCERVHGTTTPPRSTDVVGGKPVIGVAAGRVDRSLKAC